MSMKEKLQERLLHLVDDISSAKFFVLTAATILLALNKLDQNNWVMLAMMISGLKEAGTIAYNLKGAGRVEEVQKSVVNNVINKIDSPSL